MLLKPRSRTLIHNSSKITSIKDISNIANQFFIQKVVKLRKNFVKPIMSAFDILKNILYRNSNQWNHPYITIEQTIQIIMKAKSTNSISPENISMKTIKKIAPSIGPHLTHLINTIIDTSTYPYILKISCITPNLKPDKDTYDIASYRLLNNLSTVDKIIQKHIKNSLTQFLVLNNIIHFQIRK